ncbi:MAG: HTH-type transcriptional activator Btr [Tenericutes bacterium ADurb.Bin087]|nr:MAG: HTH-type transcriptional activator Btr [Tenericutes bacterium ADurb.Bin087]
MIDKVIQRFGLKTEIYHQEEIIDSVFLYNYRQIGFLELEQGYANTKKGLSEYTIWLVTEGSVILNYQNTKAVLKAGDLAFLDSNLGFTFEQNSVLPCHALFGYFRGNNIQTIYRLFAMRNKSAVLHDKKDEFSALFNEALDELRKNNPSYIRLSTIIYEILLNIVTSDQKYNINTALEQVKEYIEINYQNNINVKDLANTSNYSYYHFCHAFKEEFGVSPGMYLTKYRLQKAVQLLENHNYTLEVIYNSVGFRTKYSFIKAFKDTYNMTPSKFRTRHFGVIKAKQVGGTLFTNVNKIGDPFIIYENGFYYLFGTRVRGDRFVVYKGENLDHFSEGGTVLDKTNSFGNMDFWAPEVYKYNNEFYMFYSARGNDDLMHINVAKAAKIDGPYKDINKESPLINIKGKSTTDATLFIDEDGHKYLLFVMHCSTNFVGNQQTSEIYIVRLDDTLLKTIGEPKLLLTPSEPWEYNADDLFYRNEGPALYYHDGYYYLLYTANYFINPAHAVGLARSENVLGPYEKCKHGPVIKKIDGLTSGPGHPSLFLTKESELKIVYPIHTHIDKPSPDRRACISNVSFANEMLIVNYK